MEKNSGEKIEKITLHFIKACACCGYSIPVNNHRIMRAKWLTLCKLHARAYCGCYCIESHVTLRCAPLTCISSADRRGTHKLMERIYNAISLIRSILLQSELPVHVIMGHNNYWRLHRIFTSFTLIETVFVACPVRKILCV